ncbi:MAG TPA: elongation factor G [Chloroflexota bacterium]|nr:elongation factor G [Chloroflexota bacterium]
MKDYAIDNIRNVAVASHQGTGKTSLVEAMLYDSGATTRLGRVEEGNTVCDWDPDEISHHISINTTVAPVEWQGYKINLIDTPGYADFIGEVREGLRVADTVLMLVSAVDGLQVGTEVTWQHADERGLAKVVFVNKMDRENANFENVIAELRSRYGTTVVPVQVPIGREHSFSGVVDVLGNRAYAFKDGKAMATDVPPDLAGIVDEYRRQLVEAVAETDDDLMNKYLEEEEIGDDELIRALHAASASGSLIPVFCGAATANIGVHCLLDALIQYAPSPAEAGENHDGRLAALVFKTIADPYVGKLSFFRVYGGAVKNDSHVFNATRSHDEHIGPVLVLRGKHQEQVAQIAAGDIGAVAKLHDTRTGDTLTVKDKPVTLDPIAFPEPSFSASIIAKTKADLDKLGQALGRVQEDDPTLHVQRDPDTGETILSGIGESHLQIAVERIKRKYGVDVELGDPKIPYRETITASARAEGRHKKQTGGRGQFGDVWVEFEPNRDADFEFVNKIVGGAVPKQYIPAVEKGIQEAMSKGPLGGYPVINVRATLYDGKYHDVDSSEMAFKIAGSLAFKEGIVKCNPVLLEPIMNVEVVVPESYMGDVIGDLNSRRARVLGMEPIGGGRQRVMAQAPLAEMTHYATVLRSITQGRGTFSMSLLAYEQVPPHEAQKIVEAHKKELAAVH